MSSLLDELGIKYNADKSSRFHNYLDFYQEQLPGREFDGRLLEIGVMDGPSMKMWQEFYPLAEIVGIDIEPKDHLYSIDWQMPERVKLITMDGTDAEQTISLGMFDVIIDDGSHFTADQQASFEHLYYHQLNEGGVYIVEDIWTSRMKEYVNSELNTVDWLKAKGLDMAWHSHPHSGINAVFPQWPQYNDLPSETVVIRAGQ